MDPPLECRENSKSPPFPGQISRSVMEGKSQSFPLLKTCADSILQPFPGSPGRGEGWGTYTPVSLCASERHVEPRSEEERCSQISPERSLPGAHGARRWPPAGSWHPQASSGLRAHSFRPAPPHTHFPLAVQRPLGRCFMNCVHEYVVPTAGMLFS